MKDMCNKVQTSIRKAGFTIIELIVVIAIISTISTLVLFNSGKLNSSLLLSNTAYEIGLLVRETQIAGLGVRATDNSGSENFTLSQGIHFDITTPNKIILFADKDLNGEYTGSIEDVQTYTIPNSRAGKILALCAVTPRSTQDITPCAVGQPGSDSTSVIDILFKRPNPEAFFKKADSADEMVDHNNPVVITLGFERDICRSIIIQKTGAVQIDSSYCEAVSN